MFKWINLVFMVTAFLLGGLGCDFSEKKADASEGTGEMMVLAGQWGFASDPDDKGIEMGWFNTDLNEDSIHLPGTTDDKGYGPPHGLKPEMTREVLRILARKHSYIGPAWYQKTIKIPQDWENKVILLNLERVIWETQVWVNDQPAGMADSLITPHVYDLTDFLSLGTHRLTIRIDNSKKYNVGNMAHAHSHETQIMWNGIIGDISLRAVDRVYIEEMQVYPDVTRKTAKVTLTVNNWADETNAEITLAAKSFNGSPHAPDPITKTVALPSGQTAVEMELPMGPTVQLWDEFSPVLYNMSATVVSDAFEHQKTVRFGMREITNDGMRLLINGRPIYLRGTLECCIFPNTGHPPMDKAEWKRIIGIAQSYGLNHFRFHSWCPPSAAFKAADEMGFYFLPELPVWVGNMGRDEPRDAFLVAEADRLMRVYGNHPSYVLLSLGNELEGNFSFIRSLTRRFKENDSRRLYTSTSFTFQHPHGLRPEPVDEFFITQRTTEGWIRGQGFFNVRPPSTSFDFRDSLKRLSIPVISHEIGQYAVFPNLKEIEKYTGVNEPMNFKAIKADLERKGLLHLAEDYLQASGQLSVLLYKEDIEMALRTPGMSGFQLLDLRDFPGQGTALVGTLDAFWESKGLIEPEDYRRFCNTTVPLARMDKRTFENNEPFRASVEVAHHGPNDLQDSVGVWTISDTAGTVFQQDSFEAVVLPIGANTQLGEIVVPLDGIENATKFVLTVAIEGTEFINDWDFWVYPNRQDIEFDDDILITEYFDDEAIESLDAGRTVVLLPPPAALKESEEGRFVPVFWSPVHFPNQAITMGLLCDPSHPIFAHFPTEFHTNWQWWELMTQSSAVLMDAAPSDFEPIVRMVDGFTKNRRLYNLFEARVGNGKVLFCSMDISSDLENRIAARQLRRSILEYVSSEKFSPQQTLEADFVKNLFRSSTMLGARVRHFSSEQASNEAWRAIDGNSQTFWHSRWTPEPAGHPQELVIELDGEVEMKGFSYLPRQDGSANGRVADYAFYVSDDGTDWGDPLAAGKFENNNSRQIVMFGDTADGGTHKGRYIKFVAMSGFRGDPHTAVADIELIAP